MTEHLSKDQRCPTCKGRFDERPTICSNPWHLEQPSSKQQVCPTCLCPQIPFHRCSNEALLLRVDTLNDMTEGLIADGAAKDREIELRRLENQLERARPFIEDIAGMDCEISNKYLSIGPCGECWTCLARKVFVKE